MAKETRIADQEDENGSDEPDNMSTTPVREPGKSILKAPRVTFDPKSQTELVPFKDSIDEQDDEVIDLRTKSKSSTYGGDRSSNRYSTYSMYSIDSNGKSGGAIKVFAALIVLKIVFFDIWISAGDAITDFLQGLFLMFDFYDGFKVKDTWEIGVVVLAACWVPGLVAVLHIVAHYRNEYFGLSKTLDKDFRKSRKKKFGLMILLCFFFYPFVPTLGYIVNLWHINGGNRDYNVQTARLELFARVAHSITGCIEAPFQLIMTTWLIMKGVLDIPWRNTMVKSSYEDRFENQIPFFSIPMWTLCFSIVDILGCAIQINLFNVYIGTLRNVKSFKRYMNLVGGHFPFFFHAVCFRVITFAFLFIYLDTKAVIPLFIIWLSNIIIGYATVGKHKIPKQIRPKLKRMISLARQKANLPKITSEVQKKKNNENTPVWLNSFLSIFVPSCFVHIADPGLFADTSGLTDKQKEEHEQVKKQFFDHEKSFQQKVIKYQVQTSTTVLMISLAIVFYSVNFTEWKYHNNIFSNEEFNILCCVIGGLGVISYLFLLGIDVFELFHLNDKPGEGGKISIKYKERKKKQESVDMGEDVPDAVNINIQIDGDPDDITVVETPIKTNRHGALKKATISAIFTLLAVSPIIIGYTYSSLEIQSPAYVVMKITDDTTINIRMAKARLLNDPKSSSKSTAEGLLIKCGYNTENKLKCKNQQLNEILLMDMGDNCFEDFNEIDDIECLPYKGIILLENWKDRSSRPVTFVAKGVTKFPIVSISLKDSNKTSNRLQDGQFTNIIFNDFDSLLEQEKSDIYEIRCPKDDCTSMKYPAKKQKYIGCDGEVKYQAEVDMTCTSNGLPCPELESWKRKICKEKKSFEPCFDGDDVDCKVRTPFPPAQCIPAKQGEEEMPKSCTGEERFWEGSKAKYCWKETTKTVKYWSSECQKEVECANWGRWSTLIGTCTRSSSPEKFRFCRKSTNCVLMEIEKKHKDLTGSGGCTLDSSKNDDYPGAIDCKFS
eukprot:GFUD01022750.1.p1 GENE.GFUD01022750.1~~GFUD01022750.1.p1  ORF type:complete len:1002 (-),score=189.68 GFUD01022750.1:50-3055(-)